MNVTLPRDLKRGNVDYGGKYVIFHQCDGGTGFANSGKNFGFGEKEGHLYG